MTQPLCLHALPPQEAQSKESITQLKAEIANLTRLAEAGSALSSGEEAALNELMRQKEELTRERDTQVCWRSPAGQACWAREGFLHLRRHPSSSDAATGSAGDPCAGVRVLICAGGADPEPAHRPHGGC